MGSGPISFDDLKNSNYMTRDKCDSIHAPLVKNLGGVTLEVHDMKRGMAELKTGQTEIKRMLQEFQLLSLLYHTAKNHKLISGVILTALISALGFGSYLGFSG